MVVFVGICFVVVLLTTTCLPLFALICFKRKAGNFLTGELPTQLVRLTELSILWLRKFFPLLLSLVVLAKVATISTILRPVAATLYPQNASEDRVHLFFSLFVDDEKGYVL